RRLEPGLVLADRLDDAAVARAACIGDHNPIAGLLAFADAHQPDPDHDSPWGYVLRETRRLPGHGPTPGGSFIPAGRRILPFLPVIERIIFRTWSNCFTSWLTS